MPSTNRPVPGAAYSDPRLCRCNAAPATATTRCDDGASAWALNPSTGRRRWIWGLGFLPLLLCCQQLLQQRRARLLSPERALQQRGKNRLAKRKICFKDAFEEGRHIAFELLKRQYCDRILGRRATFCRLSIVDHCFL